MRNFGGWWKEPIMYPSDILSQYGEYYLNQYVVFKGLWSTEYDMDEVVLVRNKERGRLEYVDPTLSFTR